MKKLIYILSMVVVVMYTSCSQPTNISQAVNTQAALPATFRFKELCPLVISSSINKKEGTMATLYGNQQARAAAIAGNHKPGDGAVMALVTWKQTEDPHWFGGLIPGQLISVEVIKSNAASAFLYQRFEGPALKLNSDTTNKGLRTQHLLSLQPSVMP